MTYRLTLSEGQITDLINFMAYETTTSFFMERHINDEINLDDSVVDVSVKDLLEMVKEKNKIIEKYVPN